MGVAAFVLDYRHRGKGYGHPAPMLDVQRAIRQVRAHADRWQVKPNRIGVLGFSAGGHLASTAGTHFDRGQADATDPVDRLSCRPDFMVLCYPVIAFDEPFTHRGSQRNLLGANAPDELVRRFSNEKQVTEDTPPTFLFHTNADRGVPAENSVAIYPALRREEFPRSYTSMPRMPRSDSHGISEEHRVGHCVVRTGWPRLDSWIRNDSAHGNTPSV